MAKTYIRVLTTFITPNKALFFYNILVTHGKYKNYRFPHRKPSKY